MSHKLDSGEKHFLRLIRKGAQDHGGWAVVSSQLYALVDRMPKELVELEPVGDEGRGRARLTPEGESILNAMEWI